jgi:hypothetical protein
MQKLLDRQDIHNAISRYSLGQILQQQDETFSDDGKVDNNAAGGTVGSDRDLAK